jgi:PncC family amidohydrolase
MLNFSTKHLQLAKILTERNLQLAIAESCTGGLLSSRMTDIPGSSAYTRANFVTYANEAKVQILGVSEDTLAQHGAVSEECAIEMAQGLADKTGCDIAICTTGVAGPDGSKVGTLYVSVWYKGKITVKKFNLSPRIKRKKMKFLFTEKALELTLQQLNTTG